PVHRIGDHAAADRTADCLAPQFLPSDGVHDVEISARITEKDNATSRWSHTALNRIVGLHPPAPCASFRIDRVHPARPPMAIAQKSLSTQTLLGHVCPLATGRRRRHHRS